MSTHLQAKRIAFVVNALSGNELKAGKSDSARIYGVLVDQGLGACDPGTAILLQDCPDRYHFEERFLSVLKDWSLLDQLIFYFSGHGQDRNGLFHLSFGSENKTFFPFKNILTELTAHGVARAIVILDSCQSGAALRKGEKSALVSPIAHEDEIPRGLAIVTSCRANEYSHENDGQTQSVFTSLFCEAISSGLSGSPTPDGKISVIDLVDWVNRTLKNDPKLGGFSQTSTYGIDGAEHPVWVALNKSGRIETNATINQALTISNTAQSEPTDFDDWLTDSKSFSADAIRDYRAKLRPEVRDSSLPDNLDESSFLIKANLASGKRLYASGFLLFGENPERLLPQSYIQCFEFSGTTRSAPQTQNEFYGPLIRQLEGAMAFIESRIEKVEIRVPGELTAKFDYQYPMICIRELLANALCHRDYLDKKHHIHVRVFQDRIEITSPGPWTSLEVEENKQIDLSTVESQSAAKNERLATALRRVRLVETGGTGIPVALSDCTERGARLPTVLCKHGTVTVTIYPRTNWSKEGRVVREQKPTRRRHVGDATGRSARFRIAFSFAGEKREFVEKVARILADRFGEDKILYDKFHEAEFAVFDLGIRLPRLFLEQSELLVVIVSAGYEQGEWNGLEWPAIYNALKYREDNEVMLGRFDSAVVPSLYSTAGFVELNDKTPEQFATLILERLALNENLPKGHYTKPAMQSGDTPHTSIPHNLPSLQPFFGREEELRKIEDSLSPESRSWGAIIDGPGGMGKTSLAVRAAYDAPADAFEKIVFVSLKSRELDDDGVRDLSGFLISGLAELLNELAKELGHADIAKAIENERPRMLLDALRDTKTLLVLDNLESLLKRERDTLFAFVQKLPPGCKAITTSRGRIGSGAVELILEKLSEEAALATIAKLSETNPALAKTSEAERLTLYRETGGKPLLLRWTAGQIGRGSCVTFTDAIAYLRSCPEGNDPLEFIFGDLVDDVSEAETHTLCALTYFTLPTKVEHIAIIAERDEPQTESALKSLINRSLVVPSEELKTFTLVPLVADFLRVKKPEVLRETGDRLERHAFALVVENGYERYRLFPVLDAAWPTIAAALPRFLAGENGQLQTVCDALATFLNFTGRWDERLALSRDAESRALSAGDFDKAGWRAYDAGSVHYLRGQSAEVLACADRAESHWRDAQAGIRERAFAIRLRGLALELTKDYVAAIASYRDAVELHRTLNRESADVAVGLNSLAEAEGSAGDLDAAERDYREALRIHRMVGNHEGVAIVIGNLAELELDRENWLGAETFAREALLLSEKIGRLELIATDSYRLADALVRQGKQDAALTYAQRAVEIYQKLGLPDLARAQQILAECENSEGSSD